MLPAMRRLAKHQVSARRILFPTLRARAEAEKKPGYQKPQDTIQWMQDRSQHKKYFNWYEQCDVQLKLGLAAIHTTGTTLTHIIFDLAARPEYMEPLREEVRRVLGEEKGSLTKGSLSELRLMDSFVKESQRLSPIAYCRFS
jgi:cytochrome P450